MPAGVFVVQQIVYGDDECHKERRDLALGNVRLELVRHKIEGRSSRQRSQHARNDADDQRRPKHDLYGGHRPCPAPQDRIRGGHVLLLRDAGAVCAE